MLLAISPAYYLWPWQIIGPLVSLMKHHPLVSLLVSQNRSIPPHPLLQFLYSFLYHLPGQLRHFHFINVSHCLTQPSKSHPSSEFSPSSNNFVKVLYPIYQESFFFSSFPFKENQFILSYPVLHSSPLIKHTQIPIPGVLPWFLPIYADIIAIVWTMSPSLLTELQRAGEEVGTGPEGGFCYGGEISITSSRAMELLALTMEGGQPLQAKRVWGRCKISIFRALSRCSHPMFQHSHFPPDPQL